MTSSTTDSIQEWLKHSRSLRQTRIDKLNEFDTHSESRSSTPKQIQSPFLRKYQYAESKLERLQKELFDIRVSPPNVSRDIDTFPPQTQSNTSINDASSINTNQLQDKTMKKSQSESIMTYNARKSGYVSRIKPRKHSRSHDYLFNDTVTDITDNNPYSVNDIHPSLINSKICNISQKKMHSLSNNSSSTTSIRNKLINESEKKHQQKTKQIRHSLMELESSDIHSKSTVISNSSGNISITKSKRKSPRKLPSILREKSPLHSPKRPSFHSSTSLFVKTSPRNKTNRSLSVSFAHDTNNNNTINRVRESILFEENDTKSILSSPFKSPKSTKSLLVIAEDDKLSDVALMSPSSVLSRRSTVYDFMDETERTIVDKHSNIDIYRESVLAQLKHAEGKRESVFKQKECQNIALRHFKMNCVDKILCEWRQYTENEIAIGYKYKENKVKLKCLNEWKRMYSIINMIRKQRYLKIWRTSNVHSFIQIEKLLDFPTQSRWTLLKIISILRLSRNVLHRRKYKIIFNKLFSRYRSILLFVYFCSWRTIAQQKNTAAFNVVQMIQKYDETMMISTIRIWKLNTKRNKLKRKNAYDYTKKLHKNNVYKIYFKKWMQVFVYESTVKMALYHWCHNMEQNAFTQWIHCKNWCIQSKSKSDILFRTNILHRYFTFWLDEFIRIKNEREWKKWREIKQKTTQREIKHELIQRKTKPETNKYTYISAVHSVGIPQNLFFPYYGASNTQQMEIQIETNNDDRLTYIKHCELQSILIPTYNESMAAKYK